MSNGWIENSIFYFPAEWNVNFLLAYAHRVLFLSTQFFMAISAK